MAEAVHNMLLKVHPPRLRVRPGHVSAIVAQALHLGVYSYPEALHVKASFAPRRRPIASKPR